MKLIDLIKIINKSKSNEKSWVDINALYEELLGYFNTDIDTSKIMEEGRIKQYYLKVWYCTDTRVGTTVILFDGVEAIYTTQYGRKSDIVYYAINKEVIDELTKYLKSFIPENKNRLLNLDLDQDFDEYYSLDFSSQILQNYGYYNGQKVKVYRYNERNIYLDQYTIEISNLDENGEVIGDKVEINLSELKFKCGEFLK